MASVVNLPFYPSNPSLIYLLCYFSEEAGVGWDDVSLSHVNVSLAPHWNKTTRLHLRLPTEANSQRYSPPNSESSGSSVQFFSCWHGLGLLSPLHVIHRYLVCRLHLAPQHSCSGRSCWLFLSEIRCRWSLRRIGFPVDEVCWWLLLPAPSIFMEFQRSRYRYSASQSLMSITLRLQLLFL